MKLFEYRGKELFKKYGLEVPNGKLVSTEKDFSGLNFPLVLKAQVPIGGRGKAGGIKSTENKKDAISKLSQIIGMDIRGYKVGKVLAEEKADIKNELYLSISLDRTKKMPLIMASASGGMDIESVPDEKIIKEWINPLIGIQPFNIRNVVSKLKLGKEESKETSKTLTKIYKLFRDYDCELVEINPLIITSNGGVMALDSKVIINDDAMYRHTDIIPEHVELTPLEKDAKEKGITFIQLDGDIGVIANGAGLTMATLDALTYYKGQGGVFLDLGGTDDPEKVKQAFELMKKAKPRVIFLNLFGGITKCDTVATGVKAVITKEGINCPVITRIKGMNEEAAKEILKDAGLITATTLQDAAQRSSELVGGK
ncbi:MAG: succinate--CoA ligase subunit beta [Thermoplasmata archaeon M9B1D]|nr:MAG: succinate--CoA ligase subunit beta [Thermoplasmata archaeon M9B1D]PNX52139.1 MAG: succinate--CoA ligase subunit beta [Thermoplasmata archaeon M8B2D]